MDELNPLPYLTAANGEPDISFLRAEREVVRFLITFSCFIFVCELRPSSLTNLFLPPQGILNHCFDDIENFMSKLQQTAEAATVLSQRKKKKKKSKKQSAEGKDMRVYVCGYSFTSDKTAFD